ncbi:hypothetical protein OESDEN_01761 [Oesophagostomum dentatum]|uniref:Uncharacterized protein n=1 Tax=Oesophagostomum dentatum TaxID=61180 RepID=A0A0B1TQ79_OESDE|nr:hypothetical protein OESDEN_01761 [Oesophagostomum dentatum]
MWRDPYEAAKKCDCDSGVALWGDPDVAKSPSFGRHGTSFKTRNCSTSGMGDVLEYSGQSPTFNTTQDDLSPLGAQFVNYLHALIPGLRAVEMDLEQVVNQVKNGLITEEQVARFLSQREKVEYNRLVVGIASLRVEIANFSRKMQSKARATEALLQDQAQAICDLPFTL